MKKGGGKAKGASYERKVCMDLSRFIDPDDDETYYWRSAMSGGRATVRSRKGISTATQLGDITCVHPKGQWLTDLFVIECKFYKDLNIGTSLLFKKGNLYKFWKEVRRIAKKNNRYPMLIAKQNKSPGLVIFSKFGLRKLKNMRPNITVIAESHRTNMHVVLYDEMFKCAQA